MLSRPRSRPITGQHWPGFVDALTTLLLVIIFLLVVFVLAQVVLSRAISGKDEALQQLNRQVSELAELLDLERQANADLRLSVTQLSSSLQGAVAERDELEVRLGSIMARAEDAERRAEEAELRAGEAEQTLAELQRQVEVDEETLKTRLAELVSLRRDITALKEVRAELESDVARLVQASQLLRNANQELEGDVADLTQRNDALNERNRTLAQDIEAMNRRLSELLGERDALAEANTALTEDKETLQRQLGAVRDRSKALEARLAGEEERTLLAQKELEAREIRLAEVYTLYQQLEEDYAAEQELTAEQRSVMASLNQQVESLKMELRRLNAALQASESREEEAKATIVDLGRRLNRALASRVEELSRYRSEFFGRLREILGDRQDIQIVGDRFVFQSEVLFDTASAELGPDGSQELQKLADVLLEIAGEIPPEINWVLRVDGHTDTRPISTPRFPSNWELSAARAISVVRFLNEQGIPADRLAAAGFGEYHPLDARDDEIAYRRNRRIELKLTER